MKNASHLSFFIGRDMSYVSTVNDILARHAAASTAEEESTEMAKSFPVVDPNYKNPIETSKA